MTTDDSPVSSSSLSLTDPVVQFGLVFRDDDESDRHHDGADHQHGSDEMVELLECSYPKLVDLVRAKFSDKIFTTDKEEVPSSGQLVPLVLKYMDGDGDLCTLSKDTILDWHRPPWSTTPAKSGSSSSSAEVEVPDCGPTTRPTIYVCKVPRGVSSDGIVIGFGNPTNDDRRHYDGEHPAGGGVTGGRENLTETIGPTFEVDATVASSSSPSASANQFGSSILGANILRSTSAVPSQTTTMMMTSSSLSSSNKSECPFEPPGPRPIFALLKVITANEDCQLRTAALQPTLAACLAHFAPLHVKRTNFLISRVAKRIKSKGLEVFSEAFREIAPILADATTVLANYIDDFENQLAAGAPTMTATPSEHHPAAPNLSTPVAATVAAPTCGQAAGDMMENFAAGLERMAKCSTAMRFAVMSRMATWAMARWKPFHEMLVMSDFATQEVSWESITHSDVQCDRCKSSQIVGLCFKSKVSSSMVGNQQQRQSVYCVHCFLHQMLAAPTETATTATATQYSCLVTRHLRMQKSTRGDVPPLPSVMLCGGVAGSSPENGTAAADGDDLTGRDTLSRSRMSVPFGGGAANRQQEGEGGEVPSNDVWNIWLSKLSKKKESGAILPEAEAAWLTWKFEKWMARRNSSKLPPGVPATTTSATSTEPPLSSTNYNFSSSCPPPSVPQATASSAVDNLTSTTTAAAENVFNMHAGSNRSAGQQPGASADRPPQQLFGTPGYFPPHHGGGHLHPHHHLISKPKFKPFGGPLAPAPRYVPPSLRRPPPSRVVSDFPPPPGRQHSPPQKAPNHAHHTTPGDSPAAAAPAHGSAPPLHPPPPPPPPRFPDLDHRGQKFGLERPSAHFHPPPYGNMMNQNFSGGACGGASATIGEGGIQSRSSETLAEQYAKAQAKAIEARDRYSAAVKLHAAKYPVTELDARKKLEATILGLREEMNRLYASSDALKARLDGGAAVEQFPDDDPDHDENGRGEDLKNKNTDSDDEEDEEDRSTPCRRGQKDERRSRDYFPHDSYPYHHYHPFHYYHPALMHRMGRHFHGPHDHPPPPPPFFRRRHPHHFGPFGPPHHFGPFGPPHHFGPFGPPHHFGPFGPPHHFMHHHRHHPDFHHRGGGRHHPPHHCHPSVFGDDYLRSHHRHAMHRGGGRRSLTYNRFPPPPTAAAGGYDFRSKWQQQRGMPDRHNYENDRRNYHDDDDHYYDDDDDLDDDEESGHSWKKGFISSRRRRRGRLPSMVGGIFDDNDEDEFNMRRKQKRLMRKMMKFDMMKEMMMTPHLKKRKKWTTSDSFGDISDDEKAEIGDREAPPPSRPVVKRSGQLAVNGSGITMSDKPVWAPAALSAEGAAFGFGGMTKMDEKRSRRRRLEMMEGTYGRGTPDDLVDDNYDDCYEDDQRDDNDDDDDDAYSETNDDDDDKRIDGDSKARRLRQIGTLDDEDDYDDADGEDWGVGPEGAGERRMMMQFRRMQNAAVMFQQQRRKDGGDADGGKRQLKVDYDEGEREPEKRELLTRRKHQKDGDTSSALRGDEDGPTTKSSSAGARAAYEEEWAKMMMSRPPSRPLWQDRQPRHGAAWRGWRSPVDDEAALGDEQNGGQEDDMRNWQPYHHAMRRGGGFRMMRRGMRHHFAGGTGRPSGEPEAEATVLTGAMSVLAAEQPQKDKTGGGVGDESHAD